MIDNAIDNVKPVTYWGTAGAPLVTQAEAAVEVHVTVFTVDQEKHGGETSLLGCAALDHFHLLSVSGAPGSEDGACHEGH